MSWVLTNDDGVAAPGLAALEEAAREFGDLIVVAPASEASGCSHRTTTDSAFCVRRLGERRLAVEGTPADCVRVAIHRFGSEIEGVLAGINSGGNLGADVFHSGTVAAAREAALHGLRTFAISHYRNRELTSDDWRRATRWTRDVLGKLIARPSVAGRIWNVNLPCLAPGQEAVETVECPLDLSPLPLVYVECEGDQICYAGKYNQRARRAGADIDVCFGGQIAITELGLGC